jgi:NAD(P)-dependent dehydrogenase (short-subunit alcohol dehydrogenase family)
VTERFRDRVCLVTGSTGIAGAAAQRFAAEGATVFIATRTEDHGRKLVERLRATRARVEMVAVDLAEVDTAQVAVDACVAAFGRVDAVFNVAGGSGRRFGDGPVDAVDAAGWDGTVDLNARSLFLLCGAAVRVMLGQDRAVDGCRGAILTTSTILATDPSPVYFATHAYAAAKGAIDALGRAMAARYAPEGIRINTIAPGLTRTPMADRAAADPATMAYAAWKQPLAGGFIEPADVAAAAAFLLSGDAARITGQTIKVDGGFSVSEPPPPGPAIDAGPER